MVRPTMSHSSTKPAPKMAVHGTAVRALSPKTMETRLGTTSPRNGRAPTVTTTTAEMTETRPRPSAITCWYFRPRLVATS